MPRLPRFRSATLAGSLAVWMIGCASHIVDVSSGHDGGLGGARYFGQTDASPSSALPGCSGEFCSPPGGSSGGSGGSSSSPPRGSGGGIDTGGASGSHEGDDAEAPANGGATSDGSTGAGQSLDGGTTPGEPLACDPFPAALLRVPGAGNGAVSGCAPRTCTGIDKADIGMGTQPPDISGFAGCTTITGTIDVEGYANPDLSVLHCLEHVTGDVVIWRSPGLQTLHGLESLTEVDGSLQISAYQDVSDPNNALTRIDALTHLQAIGGELNISGGDASTSLAGLEALRVIGGDFFLWLTGNAHDLAGMNALVAIGGNVDWFRPEGLQAVSGLRKLATIGGYFAMYDATDLVTFAGLPSLACIGGRIDIGDGGQAFVNAMTRIGPFPALRRVVGDVLVYSNPSLVDAELFQTIDTVGGQIKVSDNPLLDALPSTALLHLGGALLITNEPLLSTCPLVATESRLTSAGWTDVANFSGDLGCQ